MLFKKTIIINNKDKIKKRHKVKPNRKNPNVDNEEIKENKIALQK